MAWFNTERFSFYDIYLNGERIRRTQQSGLYIKTKQPLGEACFVVIGRSSRGVLASTAKCVLRQQVASPGLSDVKNTPSTSSQEAIIIEKVTPRDFAKNFKIKWQALGSKKWTHFDVTLLSSGEARRTKNNEVYFKPKKYQSEGACFKVTGWTKSRETYTSQVVCR